MKNHLRAILGGTSAAAIIAAGAVLAPIANAAGAAEVTGTELNTYRRVSELVTDAGGQQFSVSALYTETYKTAAGNIRVGLTVRINATGIDLDEDGPGDGGLDARVRVYQGYADGHTAKIYDKTLDGASDPLNLDVSNPLNRPEITKVVISGVGVNDDGFAGAPAVTLEQPVIGNEDPGADGEGDTEASDIA